jgi:hypothetical protein
MAALSSGMAAFLATVLTATAGATAYSSFKQADAADEAKEDAKRIAANQRDQANTLASQAESRAAQEESTAASEAAGQSARARQRSKAAGSQGRRSTIATGPLGIVGDADVARKTLLGQ